MSESGRVLCVDPGSRRIGLAISDEERSFASPLMTITREGQDPVEAVAMEARRARATLVVIGLPLRLDGREGPEALRARRFAEALQECTGLEVVLHDERFTTAAAERLLRDANVSARRRRGVRDQAAAAVLLQGFLDAMERGP